jgi:heptosyltransferase-1
MAFTWRFMAVDTMFKRILIVRLSAIGDSLLSVPVLTTLRRHFQDAQLAWVTEKASAQLLQNHFALDELFIVSKRTFKNPRELWALSRKLREWKPDTTIDLQGLTKSSLVAWLSGAKNRCGFHRGPFDGRELSTWFNNCLFQSDADHIIDRGLQLLGLLGINDRKVTFDLPDTPQENEFADQTLRDLQFEGRFAIINVGAGWPSKIWPSDRYAGVASHLGCHWGVPSLVVWSGESERIAAEQVVLQSNGNAQMAPATNLLQLRCLIRRSCLFVGSDTGPMHLSVAVGTPTIGMIGPMPIERVGPYGANNVGIQKERLPESRRSERKTNSNPMHSIQIEDVTRACDNLMERLPLDHGNQAALIRIA